MSKYTDDVYKKANDVQREMMNGRKKGKLAKLRKQAFAECTFEGKLVENVSDKIVDYLIDGGYLKIK